MTPPPARRRFNRGLIIVVAAILLLAGNGRTAAAAPVGAIVGDWVGSLHAGGQTLHFVLHVYENGGKPGVLLDSIDQEAFGLKGSNVLFDGSNFSFEIHSVHGSYRGTVGNDGKTLSGAWIQNGSMPLEFTRRLLPPIVSRNLVVLALILGAMLLWRFLGARITARVPAWRRLPAVIAIAPLALTGALLATGFIYEKVGEGLDARRYAPPGRLVDVGSYKLHLFCKGTNSPTVVIETGMGTPSYLWFPVQDGVARFTRACTYDRSGYGWSEPARYPMSMTQRAAALHILLANGGVGGPYVMVGHSYGGALVRLFAHLYPSQVAGMVLVDSSEESFARMPAVVGPLRDNLRKLRTRELEARLGMVRFELRGQPVSAAAFGRPEYWTETSDEARSMMDMAQQMRGLTAPGSLDHLPLIVIRHGQPLEVSFPGMTSDEIESRWKQAQERLAALSSNSELIVASDSDHNVQNEQPQLIVDEIDRVVAAVRQRIPLRESFGTP